MIMIGFEMTDGINVYRDTLVLEDDNTLTEEEIQAMKQARFDRWLAIILNPTPVAVSDTPIENTGV